ncbi:hypothetical protein ABH924_001764 [Arthrobacter sp. GAS37]
MSANTVSHVIIGGLAGLWTMIALPCPAPPIVSMEFEVA